MLLNGYVSRTYCVVAIPYLREFEPVVTYERLQFRNHCFRDSVEHTVLRTSVVRSAPTTAVWRVTSWEHTAWMEEPPPLDHITELMRKVEAQRSHLDRTMSVRRNVAETWEQRMAKCESRLAQRRVTAQSKTMVMRERRDVAALVSELLSDTDTSDSDGGRDLV